MKLMEGTQKEKEVKFRTSVSAGPPYSISEPKEVGKRGVDRREREAYE